MFGLITYLCRWISLASLILFLQGGVLFAQSTDVSFLKQELQRVYKTKSEDSINSFIDKYYSEQGNDTLIRNEAVRIRNEFAWQETQNKNTLEAYKRFVSLYPNSVQAVFAQQKITTLTKQEQKQDNSQAYQKAKQQDNIEAYQFFIDNYPSSQWVQYAKERITQLQQQYYLNTLSQALNVYSFSSLLQIDSLSKTNSDINFDSVLTVFAFGYVQNGDTKRFDKLLTQYPQLKKDTNFTVLQNDSKVLEYLLSSPLLDKKARKGFSKYFNNLINDNSLLLLKKYGIQYQIGQTLDEQSLGFESPIMLVDSATGVVLHTFVSNKKNGLFFYYKTLKPSYLIAMQRGYLSQPYKIEVTNDTVQIIQHSIASVIEDKKLFVLPLTSIALKGTKLSAISKTYFSTLSRSIENVPEMITLQTLEAVKIKEYMVSLGANSAKIVASNQVGADQEYLLQIGFIDQ
jgi:DNA uptake lipoprotein